jgi:hypothetical protein
MWQRIKRRGRTEAFGSEVSSAVPQKGLDAIRFLVRIRGLLAPPGRDIPIRLLEKTPENCLRLPFLLALFPDARILYLTRDGRANVNSLIEGWRQPHLFPGYQVPETLDIPDYTRDRWAFTLIPGWRELTASPLEEICAWQWIRCNQAVLAHREHYGDEVPYLGIRFEDLVARPGAILPRVADFLNIDFESGLSRFATRLPSINAVTAPEQEKWRRQNPDGIARIQSLIAPMMAELGYDSTSS